MSQAIVTTYRGPTNTRGSRIIAKADAGRITVPWDPSLGIEDNHRAAALALASRYGWKGKLHTGSLPGADFAHVFCNVTVKGNK